ncbi:hypothetical protein DICVIV_02434 [Dictyocaulus viviparus]|uniref:Exocyst complex component 6 n=1 Tax=Dictyocaulus viviparus TaxID=29172 RepID=A0A0D8Y3X7_DICVI|nr:hypothetical protein DICVIV_02434 [Dictyocaulus viviparus]
MDGSSLASTKDTVGESSDTASTSYQPCGFPLSQGVIYKLLFKHYLVPDMSAEQEFFLYELETTDSGSIGLVLRAIYDCGDVRKFSRALEHRIHQYDKNIQKKDASAIDAGIQAASEDLSKKSEEIVKYRYYQALKVLEELEHTHLALVEKYRFTQILAKTMAPVRNEIKIKAYSEFKDFLENVKKVACRVGRHASRCDRTVFRFDFIFKYAFLRLPSNIRLALVRQKEPADCSRKQNSTLFFVYENVLICCIFTKTLINRKLVDVEIAVSADGSLVRKTTLNGTVPVNTSDSFELVLFQEDEKVSAQDLIDFTPVHRCCQIFNVLGSKEEFEVYYRQQRRDQCNLVIEPPTKMNSLKHYVDYLDEIIGFFVVEDHIIITEPTLVTSSHKDQLWESALKTIVHTMNTHFGGCPDVEMMLRMKKVILLFALTMKSYGYSIAPLYSLLQNFRDQYNEILMSEYCAQFERDLEKDNYTPIIVENEEQFRSVIKEFPFYKRSIEQLVQITINIGYLEKSCESLGVYITKLTNGSDINVSMTGHQLSLTERVFRDARSESSASVYCTSLVFDFISLMVWIGF